MKNHIKQAFKYHTFHDFRIVRDTLQNLTPDIQYLVLEEDDYAIGVFWTGKKPSKEEMETLIKKAKYL